MKTTIHGVEIELVGDGTIRAKLTIHGVMVPLPEELTPDRIARICERLATAVHRSAKLTSLNRLPADDRFGLGAQIKKGDRIGYVTSIHRPKDEAPRIKIDWRLGESEYLTEDQIFDRFESGEFTTP